MRSVEINETEASVYIIINPRHPLGLMVVGQDDPVGFRDPVEAVSELGVLRQRFGGHLILCRAVPVEEPVEEPVAGRGGLEQFNEEAEVEEFPYELVEEYLF